MMGAASKQALWLLLLAKSLELVVASLPAVVTAVAACGALFEPTMVPAAEQAAYAARQLEAESGDKAIVGKGKGANTVRGSRDAKYVVAVPLWAEAVLLAAIAVSWAAALYLAPIYFHPDPEGPVEYILASVPFFFLLMAVEAIVIWLARMPSQAAQYTFGDSWGSIVAGVSQQLFDAIVYKPLVISIFPMWCFAYVHTHYALWVVPMDKAWHWVVIALAADLIYYFSHRWGHEVAFLWAGHSVHHSSEHYNFSTALRQSAWQGVYHTALAFVLALFFPPVCFATAKSLNVVYQFWVHTTVIRRLGPLEWVFMTPSHHRVHHDRRVHKNFGGLLIVWDRLFGTFLDEYEQVQEQGGGATTATLLPRPGLVADARGEEVCAFGVKVPVRTWTESVLQLQEPIQVLRRMASATSAGRVLKAFVMGPGWATATARRVLVFPRSAVVTPRLRHEALLSWPAVAYHAVHFAVNLALGFVVMLQAPTMSAVQSLAMGGLCLLFLLCQGLLLDHGGTSWAGRLELARTHAVLVLVLVAYVAAGGASAATTGCFLLAAVYVPSAVICHLCPQWLGSGTPTKTPA
eukprot:m.249955 g.249955  ORF g.249955 m.249955 type:complete len:576 (-) comp19092_c0_seq7:79-1806(-)